jgi:hypothetical protein
MTENTPERQPARPDNSGAEPYAVYRERRERAKQAITRHLRGRVIYAPCKLVTLPLAGEDEKVDELIRRREYRDVHLSAQLTADGKQFRIGRTKGVPFVKPKEDKQ